MSKLGKILLVLSVVSLICFAILRFLAGAWVPFLWICSGLFLLTLVGSIWFDRTAYREFLTMKTTKKGMSMGALIATVLVFLIAINFIAVRNYKTFDFSAAQINTLSEQSKQLVGQLKEDLKVMYFYQKGSEGVEENRRAFIELMKKYQDITPWMKLQFVDVNERPDLTETYGVTKGSGMVFLEYRGRKSQLQKIDEQEVTSALVKVTREKDKTIYFTVGHGERDLDDGKESGGGQFLKLMLEGSRYTVKNLNLTQNVDAPADADVIIIAGPLHGFLENEVQVLEKFLKRGGSLIVALEPNVKHNLDKFLGKYGIELKNNYLVNFADTQLGRAVNPQSTMGSVFSETQQITKPFGKSQFVLFRLPQEVRTTATLPEGLKSEVLVSTNMQTMSYTDTRFQAGGVIGTYPVAQLITGRSPGSDPKAQEMNLVVFGDSDFLNNQMLYQNLNRDLVLNSVAALAKEENLISISPKEIGVTQMQITATQSTIFLFGFIILLPLALLSTSLVLWTRRRHA